MVVLLLVAGAMQFTSWKAKHLAEYHAMAAAGPAASRHTASAYQRYVRS